MDLKDIAVFLNSIRDRVNQLRIRKRIPHFENLGGRNEKIPEDVVEKGRTVLMEELKLRVNATYRAFGQEFVRLYCQRMMTPTSLRMTISAIFPPRRVEARIVNKEAHVLLLLGEINSSIERLNERGSKRPMETDELKFMLQLVVDIVSVYLFISTKALMYDSFQRLQNKNSTNQYDRNSRELQRTERLDGRSGGSELSLPNVPLSDPRRTYDTPSPRRLNPNSSRFPESPGRRPDPMGYSGEERRDWRRD